MTISHFKETVYAQFVVGCLSVEEAEGFVAHLQLGCDSCQRRVDWYRRLQEILQKDLGYEPPEPAIKGVLNAFRLRKPETVNLISVSAKMLFDSFLQPLPAGIRQTVLTERQVLYQVGGMQLDLKIEKTNEEQEHLIIGQLIPQGSESFQRNSPFKVLLREGEQVVQSTLSGRMGEFVFHVVPRRSYDLEILLRDSKRIYLTGVPAAHDA